MGVCETQNEFSIQIDKNIVIPSFYNRVLLHELFHMYQYYNDLDTDEDETLEQEHILLNKFYQKPLELGLSPLIKIVLRHLRGNL